jgi:hypothetical protein
MRKVDEKGKENKSLCAFLRVQPLKEVKFQFVYKEAKKAKFLSGDKKVQQLLLCSLLEKQFVGSYRLSE